jgi:heat shock protein HtpX
MAGLIASLIWRGVFHMRLRGKAGAQFLVVVLAAGLLLSIVAFLVGPLIKLALSRRRESLADASAVELTRNPDGLIDALRKLQADDQPFAKVNHAIAAMCIDNPLTHHPTWFHQLFTTHPPIEERIAALERIAQVKDL